MNFGREYITETVLHNLVEVCYILSFFWCHSECPHLARQRLSFVPSMLDPNIAKKKMSRAVIKRFYLAVVRRKNPWIIIIQNAAAAGGRSATVLPGGGLKKFGLFDIFGQFAHLPPFSCVFKRFWHIWNVFERFRTFSSVFERFRTLDLGSEIY